MKKQATLPEPVAGRIRLYVRYGPDVVDGVILGPLAIHRSVDPFNDGFSVTHVKTGRSIPSRSVLESWEAAAAYAYILIATGLPWKSARIGEHGELLLNNVADVALAMTLIALLILAAREVA